MNTFRGCALIAGFAGIAIVVVHLRAERSRCAARIVGIEAQWTALRSDLWSLQARTARLRTPQRIDDRALWFQTELVPPGVDEVPPETRQYAMKPSVQ